MTDVLPLFFYFCFPVIEKLRSGSFRWVACTLILLCVGSFFIHLQGATAKGPVEWNVKPTPIDDAPERIWDWMDLQFFR